MRIVRITSSVLAIPYEYDGPRHEVGGKAWTTLDILLVRIDTEDGLVGWGEAFGHGAIPASRAALETLVAPLFVGRDARDITGTVAAAERSLHLFGRGGPVTYALSGVEIALWDLLGKRAGLPLHQVLGGSAHTDLPAYASLLRYGDPAVVARNVAAAVAQGYRAIKLHEVTVAAVRAARAAAGPDVLLMNDCNCPWPVEDAVAIACALRDQDLHWLEEPVWPPEDWRGLARVRREGVPIAAGENAGTVADFQAAFEAGALDVAQPSVTKIGGIGAMRRVFAIAAGHGVRVVPHCAYFGPGFLASLHLAATLPGPPPMERLFVDLEASPFSPWTEARSGRLAVPLGPGLGCDPDPAIAERYEVRP